MCRGGWGHSPPGLWGPLPLSETSPSNQTLPLICKGVGGHWGKYGAIHICKACAIIESTEAPAVNTDVAELEFHPRPSKRRFHSTPGTPCFTALHLIALHRYCVSLQIEGLQQQPCFEQVYWGHITNSICPLHVSVSHFGNSCSSSNIFIFIVFAMVTGDLWSVTCNRWSLMLLLWLSEGLQVVRVFSNKVFFN